MHTEHPDKFASFYTKDILDFDLKLVEYGYNSYRPYFKGTICLELGPATGYMTRYLVNDFEKITAVEGAKELLDQITEHEKLIKVHALFEEFEPAQKYDTIVMNHVLEHIKEPVALLKRIKTWLADDGVFIVGVPNAKSFHRLAAVKMGLIETESQLNDRDISLGHYRVYDSDLLQQHLSEANFTTVAKGGIFLKFLSNGQIEKFFTPEMVAAYYQLGKSFQDNCAEIFIVAE